MTNMFKKSLVAIALAGFSTSAMAATIDNVTQVNVANEWLKNAPAGTTAAPTVVEGAEFDFVLGAAYTQNDLVRFTFTGGSLLEAVPGTIPVTGGAGGSGAGTATLGLISNEVNASGNRVVTYRVTTVDGDTTGGKGTVSGLKFRASAINGSITVTFSAETSTGQALDTGGKPRSAELVSLGNQYATLSFDNPTVTRKSGLDADIDVSESRTQFVSSQLQSETFRLYASDAGTAVTGYQPFSPSSGYGVTPQGVEYTLSGDFSWMFNPTTGALIAARFPTPAGCTVPTSSATASSIVLDCNAVGDLALSFNATGNTATIPTQTLVLDAEVSYTLPVGSSVASSEVSTIAGQWTLNGSEVQVSYMPFSTNITQVINVTNRSGQSGDVSAVAISEDGETYDLGVVGYSEAGSITRVAGGIVSALSEKTGIDVAEVAQTQRFALYIVTNAPEKDVEVYTAYNVGQSGARLVVNSSNGGGLSK